MKFQPFNEKHAREYLAKLAKDVGVPEPKLIISDEPFKNLPEYVHPDRPAFYSRREKAIYIRPRDLSNRHSPRVRPLCGGYQKREGEAAARRGWGHGRFDGLEACSFAGGSLAYPHGLLGLSDKAGSGQAEEGS